jgi:hypothetical protein
MTARTEAVRTGEIVYVHVAISTFLREEFTEFATKSLLVDVTVDVVFDLPIKTTLTVQ